MDGQKHEQKSASLFYSYAHEDEVLLKQLETHLSLLRQMGLITEWHDRQIDAGIDWKQAIDSHLMSASIILLLISPDYLASDYCYGIEMQRALERHQRNEALVIPILLRPTDWEGAPFAHLQYLPSNGEPITTWHNRDKAFVEIAKSIRAIVTGVASPLANSPYVSAPPTVSASSLPQQENSLKKASHEHYLPLLGELRPWRLIASASTVSFILCFSLLMTVLLQPSWCPSALCYPSIVGSTAATHPQGVRDANLEAYFLTFESHAFVIPGDPAHTSPGDMFNETNPQTVNAVPTENSQSSSDYRVVLVVHNLYQGRYSILIDQVALTVIDRPVMPHHLNVWVNKSLVYYDTSRYGIVYNGEEPSTVLPARYLGLAYGYTKLTHDESDQLNIQISSPITYRNTHCYLEHKV